VHLTGRWYLVPARSARLGSLALVGLVIRLGLLREQYLEDLDAVVNALGRVTGLVDNRGCEPLAGPAVDFHRPAAAVSWGPA
jgi:hypothetical protein